MRRHADAHERRLLTAQRGNLRAQAPRALRRTATGSGPNTSWYDDAANAQLAHRVKRSARVVVSAYVVMPASRPSAMPARAESSSASSDSDRAARARQAKDPRAEDRGPRGTHASPSARGACARSRVPGAAPRRRGRRPALLVLPRGADVDDAALMLDDRAVLERRSRDGQHPPRAVPDHRRVQSTRADTGRTDPRRGHRSAGRVRAGT